MTHTCDKARCRAVCSYACVKSGRYLDLGISGILFSLLPYTVHTYAHKKTVQLNSSEWRKSIERLQSSCECDVHNRGDQWLPPCVDFIKFI